jgi:hypothetical protein
VRGSFHMPDDMAYAHKSFSREPSINFEDDESLSWSGNSGRNLSRASSLVSRGGSFLARSLHLRSSSHSATSTVGSFRLKNVQVQTKKPSDHYPLYDLQVNSVSLVMCPSVNDTALCTSHSLRSLVPSSMPRLCTAFCGNDRTFIPTRSFPAMGGI